MKMIRRLCLAVTVAITLFRGGGLVAQTPPPEIVKEFPPRAYVASAFRDRLVTSASSATGYTIDVSPDV